MIAAEYVKKCTVKSYEADCHGVLRLLSLMNYLQEAATESADMLGLGFDVCAEKGLTWFGSDYVVEIDRLPRMHEEFVITTWPSEVKLWGSVRDFSVTDSAGLEIMRASSQWVLIDLERRRPAVLKKYFAGCEVLNKRALQTDFPKISELPEQAEEKVFRVRFDDIDINRHVNNAVYLLWASECVPVDFRTGHFPWRLAITYKKEAVLGENIRVRTVLNNSESVHSIYAEDKSGELSRCSIDWAEITSE